ncbi:MAG: hypothetical protein EA366_08095 [Spirulina sp. DLM2.Bin59]|nr:MAG: hypothetical protein EA366_08095 [Spirulina sp. DLM2.Bin59]
MKPSPLPDPFAERPLTKLQLWFTLIPFLGPLPALWWLWQPQTSPQQRQASRLALRLFLIWLAAIAAFSLGATQAPDQVWQFRLLFFEGTLSSIYVLTCLGLMFQVWQGKNPRLPGGE